MEDDESVDMLIAGVGLGVAVVGTREFATLDLDGNLLSFFRWEDA